jgi:MFS family permease
MLAQDESAEVFSEANPSIEGKAADAPSSTITSDTTISENVEIPPLFNYTNSIIVLFFMISFGCTASLISNSGALYFVLAKNMSQIWYTNVAVIIIIINTPVSLYAAQVGDNLSGNWAKYGRRKPFIALGIPFLVLSSLMVGVDVSSDAINIWFLLLSILMTIGTAFVGISFTSWIIESARDNDDYNNINMMTTIGGIFGGVVGGVATQSAKNIGAFAFIFAVMLLVSTILLLYFVPTRVLKQAPKLPPIVPSFRTCVRTKEFRMLFTNEFLLQIATNGVGALLLITMSIAFRLPYNKDIMGYVAPTFGALLVLNIIGAVVTNRLIVKYKYDKLEIYKKAVLIHAFFGFGTFCTLIPSMINANDKTGPPLWLEADMFMGMFALAAGIFTPISFIQGLLKRDLIVFDTFVTHQSRENVYQTALQLPATLMGTIIVNIFVSILESTGYETLAKPKGDNPTILETYSWNQGSVIQLASYVLLFSGGLGLLSYYFIKDYPLTTALANRMEGAVKIRDRNQKEREAHDKNVSIQESGTPATPATESSISSMDVHVPYSDDEEQIMLLHLSNLECEVISESPIANGSNVGLASIRFSSYFSSGVLGVLALGALTSAGVYQIKDHHSLTQIVFTFVLAVACYMGYEVSRASVIHKLNHTDVDEVKAMAQRQVVRNKNYGVTLQELMDRNGIKEEDINEDNGDETFARLTLSAKANKRMSIVQPIENEKDDSALSGYKRIYLLLTLAIAAGITLTVTSILAEKKNK